MLKIIKYDLKSTGIIAAVFALAALIVNTVFIILIAQTDMRQIGDKFDTGCTLNMVCFVVFVLAAAGNMWKRVNGNTELYEMAGVSPLKVGAARVFVVFASVTAFAYLLTLGESVMYRVFYTRLMRGFEYNSIDYSIALSYLNNISSSMFALNGMKWTNIFTPVFAGLNISIVFTTSFLFSTLTRRFDNKLASSLVLGAMVALAVMLNFMVLNKINIYLPELNLNKLGVGGQIIERFGNGFPSTYSDFTYLINPNLLNMGLLLFQALYVALMFSVYSIRRKAV